VTRPDPRGVWLAAVLVCLLAAPAWAQLQLPPGSPVLPPGTEGAARRGPVTITPTISVLGEYNDNVFQSNANKVSDFILGFSPGISVAVESPIYRLIGSYSFTAEIYAEQEQLNDVFSRQNLRLEGSYRLTPLLTLSLTDSLIIANDSNSVAAENVSTGRTRSLANTLSPGVSYQLDPRTTLRGGATWTMLRYDSDLALDSDTYAVEGFGDYAFTPRLTGSAGYQFAYFDVEDGPGVTTHTPRVGVTYRFTSTLTGTVSGGPTIQVIEDGDTSVHPAVAASLQQRFSWGSAALQYDHAIGTSGGLGGTTENQSLGAVVQLDRLVRGLIVQVVPRYSRASSTGDTTTDNVDVDTFSLTLQGRYEFTRYIAGIAGYTYFMQRSNSTVNTAAGTITANDVDQNRVFVGLQFGYPISID
jgi:opacity protein-like surface antigen